MEKAKASDGKDGTAPVDREWHPDSEVLARLAEHYDSDSALADKLGVSPQAVNNWKRRGIAPAKRDLVMRLMKRHRCEPLPPWKRQVIWL